MQKLIQKIRRTQRKLKAGGKHTPPWRRRKDAAWAELDRTAALAFWQNTHSMK